MKGIHCDTCQVLFIDVSSDPEMCDDRQVQRMDPSKEALDPGPEREQGLRGCKVIIVGINYSPEATGIGPYTTALADFLDDAGAEVTVITGVPHYPQWRVDPRYRWGVHWSERLGNVDVERVRHFVPRRAGLAGRALMEATFLVGALVLIARRKSDILIAVSPALAAAGAAQVGRRKRPLGVLVQDLVGNAASESGTSAGAPARLIGQAERTLLLRADLVGVINEGFVRLVEAEGVQQHRVRLVPNFSRVTPPTIDRLEARKRLGWPLAPFTVVHTGNMGRKQGLETVIEAARRASVDQPDLRFVLVGDGNQREQLEASAQGVSSIDFLDPVPDDAYQDVLAAADVLLVCEKPGVRSMSLPSKITSYAMAGRVILAAVEPEGLTHRYLADRGIAILAERSDAESLLNTLAVVRRGGDRIARVLERAQQVATNELSAASAAERYRDFTHQLWKSSTSQRSSYLHRHDRPPGCDEAPRDR